MMRKEQMDEEYKEMERRGGSFGSMMKGILVGGLIGAGLALLSAPRSGDETREILRDKSLEIREKAMDKADEARTKAEDLARQGTDKANDLVERGQEVVNTQKTNLQSVVEGIRTGVKTYAESNPSSMDQPENEI
jgi:gas vesicle protein